MKSGIPSNCIGSISYNKINLRAKILKMNRILYIERVTVVVHTLDNE